MNADKAYFPGTRFYIEGFFPVNDDIKEFVRDRGRAGIGIGHNASRYWRISLIVTLQSSLAGIENTFDITDFAYPAADGVGSSARAAAHLLRGYSQRDAHRRGHLRLHAAKRYAKKLSRRQTGRQR